MKKTCKKILTAVLAGCLVLGLAACGGAAAPAKTEAPAKAEAPAQAEAAALSRLDYVADMKGNTVDITIAQNMKTCTLEIKAMGLTITAYCTVDGNTLTLTELADGNEQLYAGLSAAPFTLNEDGTAVQGGAAAPAEAAAEAPKAEGLSRFDYVADMQGNSVDITISQNMKTCTLEIKAMKLNITAYCTVDGNTLTLTELAEGNEQFYKGLAAAPFTLNEDGTAVQQG